MIAAKWFDAQGLVAHYEIATPLDATSWLGYLGKILYTTQGHNPHEYVYLGMDKQGRGFMVIMDFSKVNGGREFKYDV